MLCDYAYRYTRSILSDAANLAAEGYGTIASATTGPGGRASKAAQQNQDKDEDISITSLRLAVACRQITQFQPVVSKHDLLEMAAEVNKVGLPRVEREFGVRVPAERHLFTGGAWRLMEEWEDEVSVEGGEEVQAGMQVDGEKGDTVMGDGEDEEGDGVLGDGMGDEDEDDFNEVMGNNTQDATMGGT